MPAPLLLLAVLLVGWAASPCDAQGPYAAPGNNSILLLNSTLNVRHAHVRRKVCAHICEAFLAASSELQDAAFIGHMVYLHPCLVADIIACVRCDAVGRSHIDYHPEISAGVPVGAEQHQLPIKGAMTSGSVLAAV